MIAGYKPVSDFPGVFSARPAIESDLDDLTCFKGPVALHRDRLRDMAGGSLQYFVVENGGEGELFQVQRECCCKEIIGYGMVVIHWPETWLGLPHQEQLPVLVDLFIKPEARGKGAGSLLIHKLEEYARSRGCTRLYLSVDPVENPRAHQLYLRLGYQPMQAEPYLDHWEFTDSDGNVHRGEELTIGMVKELIDVQQESTLPSPGKNSAH